MRDLNLGYFHENMERYYAITLQDSRNWKFDWDKT